MTRRSESTRFPKSVEKMRRVLPHRIRTLRGATSKRDWSKRLGIARLTVIRWEQGEFVPDAAQLVILAREHRESVDWILGLTDNRKAMA